MDVVVALGGLEDAGAGGGGCLEGHLPPLEDLENVLEVAAVEGDLGLGAFEQDGVNLILVVPDGFRFGGDDGLAGPAVFGVGFHLHPDDVAAVPGEDGGAAGGAKEVGEIEYGPGGEGLGYELLVVGEGPLEQLGHQFHTLGAKEDLSPRGSHHHLDRVVAFTENPGEFVESAGRDDDLDGGFDGLDKRAMLDGQPETVGGGESEVVFLQLDLDAGEDGTGLLGGGGEGDPGDGITESLGMNLGSDSVIDGGDGGEFAGIGAVDVGIVASAGDLKESAAGGQLQVDPLAGKGADELAQETGGNGDGAFLLDAGADPGGDGDFQVGGRELQHGLLGAEQDVLGDGQGGTGGNGPSDQGQSSAKVFLQTGKLHHAPTDNDLKVAPSVANLGNLSRLPGGSVCRSIIGFRSVGYNSLT